MKHFFVARPYGYFECLLISVHRFQKLCNDGLTEGQPKTGAIHCAV